MSRSDPDPVGSIINWPPRSGSVSLDYGSASERNISRSATLLTPPVRVWRKKKTWPTFSVLASSHSPSSMSRWSGLSRLSVGATPSSCSFSSHVNLRMRTIVLYIISEDATPSSRLFSSHVNLRMRTIVLSIISEKANPLHARSARTWICACAQLYCILYHRMPRPLRACSACTWICACAQLHCILYHRMPRPLRACSACTWICVCAQSALEIYQRNLPLFMLNVNLRMRTIVMYLY